MAAVYFCGADDVCYGALHVWVLMLGKVVDELQDFLDKVTEIKLAALTQLTHEELRSDQAFSIFLLQCANLISKIQLKILNCSSKR